MADWYVLRGLWLWSGKGMMDAHTPRIMDGWISQCVYLPPPRARARLPAMRALQGGRPRAARRRGAGKLSPRAQPA